MPRPQTSGWNTKKGKPGESRKSRISVRWGQRRKGRHRSQCQETHGAAVVQATAEAQITRVWVTLAEDSMTSQMELTKQQEPSSNCCFPVPWVARALEHSVCASGGRGNLETTNVVEGKATAPHCWWLGAPRPCKRISLSRKLILARQGEVSNLPNVHSCFPLENLKQNNLLEAWVYIMLVWKRWGKKFPKEQEL
jgi:hypothetical protein